MIRRHPTRRFRTLTNLAAIALPLSALPAARGADGDLRPATAAAPQDAGDRRIQVYPFASIGDATLGAGLTDAVVAGLETTPGVKSVNLAATDKAGAPPATARAADAAAAQYAVAGTVQSFGGEVRVTGKVIDARTGDTIANLRAGGPTTRFFAIQDALVEQVARAVGLTPQPPVPPIAATPAASPAAAPAQGSYWAEYMALYEPVAATGGQPYPPYPPQPPAPPLYGGSGINYAALGGGSYSDGGWNQLPPGATVTSPGFGTVRTQTFNSLGTSIIAPPPGLSQASGRAAASYYAPRGATPAIPAYAAPITAYRNPWTQFATPVGQPQRVAPPVLRPGNPAPNLTPTAVRSR